MRSRCALVPASAGQLSSRRGGDRVAKIHTYEPSMNASAAPRTSSNRSSASNSTGRSPPRTRFLACIHWPTSRGVSESDSRSTRSRSCASRSYRRNALWCKMFCLSESPRLRCIDVRSGNKVRVIRKTESCPIPAGIREDLRVGRPSFVATSGVGGPKSSRPVRDCPTSIRHGDDSTDSMSGNTPVHQYVSRFA
jgi:hypothetical protein